MYLFDKGIIMRKRLNLYVILTLCILFITLGFLCLFINVNIIHMINSDDSSELILGKILSEEHGILSKNWHYSTEIRFLNSNLLYKFFFAITDNWHHVRVLSHFALYLILLLTYFLLCKSLKCTKYYAITCAALFVPFSSQYFDYILRVAYYIPYIAISFFIISLGELFDLQSKKNNWSLVALASVISMLSGMNGIRQMTILQVPMLVASIWLWLLENKKYIMKNNDIKDHSWLFGCRHLIYSLLIFLSAGIGYIINAKIFTKIYSFKTWDDISFTNFKFANLEKVISGLFTSFGFVDANVFSSAIYTNCVSFIWMALFLFSLVYGIKKNTNASLQYKRFAIFTFFSFLVYLNLYLFTDLSYSERYNLPILIMSLPLIACFFNECDLKDRARNIIISTFVIMILGSGLINYRYYYSYDVTRELREISDLCIAMDYHAGYSTFWRSNILTELSNGEIEMWSQAYDEEMLSKHEKVDETFQWLQKKSHDTSHPEGKIILLYTLSELEACNWAEELNEENIIYQSDLFVVYGYDDYILLPENIRNN